MKKEEIVRYYESCEVDYRLLWDLNHSYAMHAGYWDETTTSLRDALRRENEILADIVKIKSTDHVLDAGCGVGGSSIFLAKTFGCKVTGITLLEKQVSQAEKYAHRSGVSSKAQFEVMDYSHTNYPDETFDVIWAIESICHAPDKKLFLKEAYRLLKKGGRMVIADGFTISDAYEDRDQKLMSRWLKGWGVNRLETVDIFENHCRSQKFQNIVFRDVTSNILPSARRLYMYSWPAVVLSRMGEWLGVRSALQTENLHSARCHYQALKRGLWLYGIFYAEK